MKRLALTMAIAVSFSCTGTAFGQGRPSDAEGESYGLGMTGRPPGRSEDSVQAGPINVGGVQMTAAEQSAFSLVNSGKYIRARKEAEDLLKENPDSFIGKYVLARVFHFGEGNLLRAMQLYREALTRFEAEYCQGSEIPATSTLQNWHQLVLTDIARLYGELDHREAQLAAYDRVDALYKTPRSIRSTWALIKLGRFEEADEIIQATIKGEDSFSRDEGYNNAIALADAMYSHTRAYQAGLEAINYTGTRSCVILSNHARSERQFLEFDSALENIMKASHANNDCPVPPLLSAVPIYLTMGGYQQAISTMLKVRRMPIEKRMVVQLEMQLRTALANLFHIMGFSDKAHSLMRTVLDAPDRLGFDSLHQDQVRLANLITFHAIMSDYLRQIDDEIAFHKAYSPRWFFSKAQREAMFERYKLRESLLRARWSNDQQAYRLVLDPKNLMALLVPFYVMDPPMFYAVADTLGARTAGAMIAFERARLQPEELAHVNSVLFLLEAYVAWRQNRLQDALSAANAAIDGLDDKIVLLRRQAQLIRGAVQYALGQAEAAYADYYLVMEDYPAAFRHFAVPLPIVLEDASSASPNAQKLFDMLIAAPGFISTNNAPFVVSVSDSQRWPQICLMQARGRRITCSSLDIKDYSGDEDVTPTWPEIVQNFARAVFSPRVDLSRADIHSLDGSTLRVSATQALEELIKVVPQSR